METRMKRTCAVAAAILCGLHFTVSAFATPDHKPAAPSKSSAPRITAKAYLAAHPDREVAYDAKDRKFYSVAYARAHGMRDKGGDTLTIHRLSALPKDAAMSHAMHGKM